MAFKDAITITGNTGTLEYLREVVNDMLAEYPDAGLGGFSTTLEGLEDVDFTDPNEDIILFWNDSANQFEALTLGSGLTITTNTLDVTSGATDWGDIGGTLADQTDLQTALDGKSATSHTHTLTDITDSGDAAALGVTGADLNVVTGTAGIDGNFLSWNVDGDAVDSGSTTSDFATAAQGTLADSAVQPSDNVSVLTNDAGYITATLTDEEVQDVVGGMVTGNTETFVTVTYQDGDGTLDFAVPVLDEDDMTSDSAVHLATQQSIKAYVDSQGGDTPALDDLTDVVITSESDNEVLAYDSSSGDWINQTAVEAGLATSAQGSLADSALQNVVEDTTPELGGNLDVNGNEIQSTSGNIILHTDASLIVQLGTSAPDAVFVNDSNEEPVIELHRLGHIIGKGLNINGAELGGGLTITTILDEDTMSSDSATALATQQSIKAYVDSQAGGISDVVEDTTPQLGGNLDVNGNLITSPDGTDQIQLVDGSLTFRTASTTRISITDSGVRFGGTNATVTTILDEDTMSSDSATALATQQSIKAYVDSQAGGTVDFVSNVDTSRVLGRVTAGNGNSEELTAAQVRTLINVEDGADVTDATNVDAAGAVMESDTSTSAMSFVIDEDTMSSDSATKVPTQQSVKAYVDSSSGTDPVIISRSTTTDVVSCTGVIPQDGTLPQNNEGTEVFTFNVDLEYAVGWVRVQSIITNARAVGATGSIALFSSDLGFSGALGASVVAFPTLSVSMTGITLEAWVNASSFSTGSPTFEVRAGPVSTGSSEEVIIGSDDGAGGNVFGSSIRTCEIVVTEYPSGAIGDIT